MKFAGVPFVLALASVAAGTSIANRADLPASIKSTVESTYSVASDRMSRFFGLQPKNSHFIPHSLPPNSPHQAHTVAGTDTVKTVHWSAMMPAEKVKAWFVKYRIPVSVFTGMIMLAAVSVGVYFLVHFLQFVPNPIPNIIDPFKDEIESISRHVAMAWATGATILTAALVGYPIYLCVKASDSVRKAFQVDSWTSQNRLKTMSFSVSIALAISLILSLITFFAPLIIHGVNSDQFKTSVSIGGPVYGALIGLTIACGVVGYILNRNRYDNMGKSSTFFTFVLGITSLAVTALLIPMVLCFGGLVPAGITTAVLILVLFVVSFIAPKLSMENDRASAAATLAFRKPDNDDTDSV